MIHVKAHTRRRPEKPRVYLDIHEILRIEVDSRLEGYLARELAEALAAFVAEVRGH